MTAYHGGKQRIGKKLAKVIYEESMEIEDEYDFTIKGYCEPFAGMLGVYQHIPELFKDHKPKLKYKAGEINKSVAMMWNAAKKGWKPPRKVSRKKFGKLKISKDNTAEKGFVGHAHTFRGTFFDSYFKHSQARIDRNVNNVKEIGNILKKNNVIVSSKSYTQYSSLKGYVIYCDPPYANTEQRYYKDRLSGKLKFDTEKFWDWCRKMSKDNIVFISGYSSQKSGNIHNIWSHNKEKLYLMY
jgi:DNA adenine methylase